jgi:hypothetical protein
LLYTRAEGYAVRIKRIVSWQRIEFAILLAAFRVVLVGLASTR